MNAPHLQHFLTKVAQREKNAGWFDRDPWDTARVGAIGGGAIGGAKGLLGLAGGPLALLTIPAGVLGGGLVGGGAGLAGQAMVNKWDL